MTIEELNEITAGTEASEFVRVCEARQVKALSGVADAISSRGGVRLVLLAGGSSAGKTTTAKRLSTQLRVDGMSALHISTDDYFVGDARNPRDENGEFDYETVEAVDVPRLAKDLDALFAGRPVRLRRFDFIRHDGFDADRETVLPDDGCVVVEGIHALNPVLTRAFDDGCKYRVFVAPQPDLEIFLDLRLPSAWDRFVRRLVRDNRYRRLDPASTVAMWPRVLAGEKKWIEPFSAVVDSRFDSYLPYEAAVLQPYAMGLLERALRVTDNERLRALRDVLSLVSPLSPAAVPGDSILRETIGGSNLDY